MPRYYSDGSPDSHGNRSLPELKEFVSNKAELFEKTARQIKEMTLTGNFNPDVETQSINFQAMAAKIDELFKNLRTVTDETKNSLRQRQSVVIEMVKSQMNVMEEERYRREMDIIEEELNELVSIAHDVSENAGNTFAELLDILRDTGLASYYINSIISEFDLNLSVSDSKKMAGASIKSQIFRIMKPIATQRFVPSDGQEDKSGVTTYQQMLQQATEIALRQKHGTLKEERELKEEVTKKTLKDLLDDLPTLITPPEKTNPPIALMPKVTVLTERKNDEPAAEYIIEHKEPRQHLPVPASKTKPGPEPSPSPIIKKSRAKIWAVLAAGVALAGVAVCSRTADDGSKTVAPTATIMTTTTPEKTTPPPVKAEMETLDNQKKLKYTVSTDHSDYSRYVSNFTDMHAFLADLNYAVSNSEFELDGAESQNQIKLKALRGVLESGVKTATSGFAAKAFKLYLSNLDHLEREISTGRLDIDSEDLMNDGRYNQIRLMAEGIKNVVPAVPPENIAGYKINQNDCHPLEVFTHNYLSKGGAPAFHTTVMSTLDNIAENPFVRNDSAHVTKEFFGRLHRQAAAQKAKNSVDGSPMVARSVEKFVRSGGRNEISEMLRGCVVPVYKDGAKPTPPDDEETVNTDNAIPINYNPSAPSPTGLNDIPKNDGWKRSWGEKTDTDAILGNITQMLADNGPEITVTGEEYMDLSEEVIELTEADIINDDESEIELTEADIINDDEEILELTEADFIEEDEPEIELTEEDIIIEEEPAPVKKSFFARAAAKVKGLFG